MFKIENKLVVPNLPPTFTRKVYFDFFLEALYQEFLGMTTIQANENRNGIRQTRAEFTLNNMKLCSLCNLQDFLCDYEKNYYSISDLSKREVYRMLIFDKIPQISINSKEQYKQSSYPATLGGVIRWIKDEITKECNQYRFRKRVKKAYKTDRSVSCDKLDFTVKEYGCKKSYSKRKNRRKKYPKYFKKRFKPIKRKSYKRKFYKTK